MPAPPDPPKPTAETNPVLATTQDQGGLRGEPRPAGAEAQVGELIGQMIGQYKIIRQLGSGGMGVVYEAEHESIGQRAAVKALRTQISTDPVFVQRFFNEARAATIAQHASLVKLFDYGQLPNGVLYMLMEFLDGESLRARLDRLKILSEAESLRLARQIAAAVGFVHRKGIVHRDLKPENIIIVNDVEAENGERAKILDFGLAKIHAAEHSRRNSTSVHAVAGTPLYMSPEQCRGLSQAGSPADVYALGIMLYEMLCGHPPFGGELPGDLLVQHMSHEPPSLAEAAPQLSRELVAIVHRMLVKAPEQRPTMQEIEQELAQLPSGSRRGSDSDLGLPPRKISQPAVPPARTRRFSRPVIGAALALLTVGAGVLTYTRMQSRSTSQPGQTNASTKMVRLPGGAFTMGSLPDESSAAFFYCQQVAPAGCTREVFEREQPARRVTLSPYWLDATEVTNEQFAAFLNQHSELSVDANYHRLVSAGGTVYADLYPMMGHGGLVYANGKFSALLGFEHRPVTQITWDGATAYCAAASKQLPTEAQWEFAARADQSFRFPWGFDEPRCDGVTLARGKTRQCAHLPPGPSDVGTSTQDHSPQGLFDLAGNVSEWVQDEFTGKYAACPAPCRDPVARRADNDARPEGDLRVVRGGDWSGLSVFARAAARSRILRTRATGSVGFRCARPGS